MNVSELYGSPCTKRFEKKLPFDQFQIQGTGDYEQCQQSILKLFNNSYCPYSHCAFNGVFLPPLHGNFGVSLWRREAILVRVFWVTSCTRCAYKVFKQYKLLFLHIIMSCYNSGFVAWPTMVSVQDHFLHCLLDFVMVLRVELLLQASRLHQPSQGRKENDGQRFLFMHLTCTRDNRHLSGSVGQTLVKHTSWSHLIKGINSMFGLG